MLKTVGSRSILYVMAADAEYGPHLQARFTPLVCGVGPVESAVNLTRALTSERPHIVISLGSAGSRTLEQAEVYEVASVSYRDMDASPLGFEKGRTPFLDLPAELPCTRLVLDEGEDLLAGRVRRDGRHRRVATHVEQRRSIGGQGGVPCGTETIRVVDVDPDESDPPREGRVVDVGEFL